MRKMFCTLCFMAALAVYVTTVFAITAVRGTVQKIDAAAKTIVVKAADGTVHIFHFATFTMVHGAEGVPAVANDSMQGLQVGSEVVVHYTEEGTEKTALEVDHVGKDGLKVIEGTITRLDRAGKSMAVKTASGTQETFVLTGSAAEDGGSDIAKGTEKSGRVTVHYTEEGGRKIAHFFGKSL